VVPRQVIVLAVFRIEPKVDIKFLTTSGVRHCKWLRPAAVAVVAHSIMFWL
jgi:hypothetical protein